jgi:hypothetical protein
MVKMEALAPMQTISVTSTDRVKLRSFQMRVKKPNRMSRMMESIGLPQRTTVGFRKGYLTQLAVTLPV